MIIKYMIIDITPSLSFVIFWSLSVSLTSFVGDFDDIIWNLWIKLKSQMSTINIKNTELLLLPAPFFPFTHFNVVSVSIRARLRRSPGPYGVNWRPSPSLRLLHSWLWGFSCLQLWPRSQYWPPHQDLRARVILQGLCHHRHGNVREMNPSAPLYNVFFFSLNVFNCSG